MSVIVIREYILIESDILSQALLEITGDVVCVNTNNQKHTTMILNILMILLGISTLIYSFYELRVWGSLYFDRDIYCIEEKYRKVTKATDLVNCVHNMTKSVFGFTLIVAGLKCWMPVADSTAAPCRALPPAHIGINGSNKTR